MVIVNHQKIRIYFFLQTVNERNEKIFEGISENKGNQYCRGHL